MAVGLFSSLPAHGADHAARIAEAGRLLGDARYAEAEVAVRPLLADTTLLRAERAEAFRIHGLALFNLGRRPEAEASFRQYLTLEPDAHLDPALYTPDAVVFFEAVRARHAGAVINARPPPPRRRSAALNLIPPLGQVQNGDTTKAWVIGSLEISLLATNIATYAMLSSSCSDSNLTCERDPSSARALRAVNLASGGLFLAVYAYGVIDGFVGKARATTRERERERSVRTAVVPVPGGVLVGGAARF